MQILISGATGFVGSALSTRLEERGDTVWKLTRAPSGNKSLRWSPLERKHEIPKNLTFDAVVHLAGENVSAFRWSKEKKRKIDQSRQLGTQFLSDILTSLEHKPQVLLSASAIGYYGNRRDDWLDESSAPGQGFFPSSCLAWEAAANPVSKLGVRVVSCRFGVILDPSGGALRQMLPGFKAGLGAVLGDGAQYLSWVSLDDAVSTLLYLLESKNINGPVNVVSPSPVTNREFSHALSRRLRRPLLFRVPKFMLRAILGEMADNLLLASARVQPKKLLDAGFAYQHPTLDKFLEDSGF